MGRNNSDNKKAKKVILGTLGAIIGAVMIVTMWPVVLTGTVVATVGLGAVKIFQKNKEKTFERDFVNLRKIGVDTVEEELEEYERSISTKSKEIEEVRKNIEKNCKEVDKLDNVITKTENAIKRKKEEKGFFGTIALNFNKKYRDAKQLLKLYKAYKSQKLDSISESIASIKATGKDIKKEEKQFKEKVSQKAREYEDTINFVSFCEKNENNFSKVFNQAQIDYIHTIIKEITQNKGKWPDETSTPMEFRDYLEGRLNKKGNNQEPSKSKNTGDTKDAKDAKDTKDTKDVEPQEEEPAVKKKENREPTREEKILIQRTVNAVNEDNQIIEANKDKERIKEDLMKQVETLNVTTQGLINSGFTDDEIRVLGFNVPDTMQPNSSIKMDRGRMVQVQRLITRINEANEGIEKMTRAKIAKQVKIAQIENLNISEKSLSEAGFTTEELLTLGLITEDTQAGLTTEELLTLGSITEDTQKKESTASSFRKRIANMTRKADPKTPKTPKTSKQKDKEQEARDEEL